MRREIGMFVALVVLCTVLAFSNSDFLGHDNVLFTTRQIALLGIFAIGSAFVIITGGIDLSVGSLVGLTGVMIAKFSSNGETTMGMPIGFGLPIGVGIALALAIVLLIGLAQGLLITRLGLQPFIVTLGGMLLLRGVSQTIAKGGSLGLGDIPFNEFANSGVLYWNGEPLLTYPVLIFLIIIVLATYLLHFTVYGRYLFAIGGNRDAAEYSGIPVRRTEASTYVISAGLAGVAGVCYASYIKQMGHTVGNAYELLAIASCVLGACSLRGGEGTIFGVVIGVTIMRVIENGLDMFRVPYHDKSGVKQFWHPDENWKFIVIGAVILIAVILDQVVHILQAKRRTRRAGFLARQSAPTAPTSVA